MCEYFFLKHCYLKQQFFHLHFLSGWPDRVKVGPPDVYLLHLEPVNRGRRAAHLIQIHSCHADPALPLIIEVQTAWIKIHAAIQLYKNIWALRSNAYWQNRLNCVSCLSHSDTVYLKVRDLYGVDSMVSL